MTSRGTLSTLLDLIGYAPEDTVWIAALDHSPNVEFPFSNLPAKVSDVDSVVDGLTQAGRSTYFMVNRSIHTTGRKRGLVGDISQAMALYVDIDVKEGGVPTWEAAGDVIDRISHALGCDPVAIVHSGHGLQPYWALEEEEVTDENRAEVMRLYERFGALARIQAQLAGGQLDSVFDLPRVLRAPGGVNYKREPYIPTTLHVTGAQTPYTFRQLRDVLDEWEIPEVSVVDVGTKIAELATWNGGDLTVGSDCSWFDARVEELSHADPKARHPWALGAAIELISCVRYGCVSMAEGIAGVQTVGARLEHLVTTGTNPRPLARGEVTSILQYAIRFVEALTDEQVLQQAGYHVHDLPEPDSPFGLAAAPAEPAEPAERSKPELDEFAYAARLDPTGDAGIAHAAYQGLKGRYLLTPAGNPLRWDGNHWEEDRLGHFDADFNAVVTRYIRELYSRRQINPEAAAKMTKAAAAGNGQKLLRSWNKLIVDPLALNANHLTLATPGGIVELETGRLRAADPETDLNTQITKFAPEIGVPERWLAFLRQVVVDEERISYLQRILGSSLVGGQRWPDLPIFVGKGANGKSVILRLAREVLGSYAMSLPEGFLTAKSQTQHPTELADLRGKRLATLSEVDPHGKFNESRLKSLTGGDPIRARKMRQDFEEFNPTHTFVLALNHLLQVASGGDSLFRRIKIITFDVQIPVAEQIPFEDFVGQLLEEGGRILSWLIEGARLALASGLPAPKRVIDDTLNYRYEEDHVANFAAEMLTAAPGGRVLREELMRAYSRWCRLNVQEPLPGPQFFRELPAKIDLESADPTAPRHYVYGIRLTSDVESEKTGFVQPGGATDWAARAAGEDQ